MSKSYSEVRRPLEHVTAVEERDGLITWWNKPNPIISLLFSPPARLTRLVRGFNTRVGQNTTILMSGTHNLFVLPRPGIELVALSFEESVLTNCTTGGS